MRKTVGHSDFSWVLKWEMVDKAAESSYKKTRLLVPGKCFVISAHVANQGQRQCDTPEPMHQPTEICLLERIMRLGLGVGRSDTGWM